MDAKLKVLGGSRAGMEIPLKKAKFVIGRASGCSLRAGSDAISRRHTEITLTRSSVTIADLGSRNGTFVNGERISKPTPIKSGDEVRIGPLRFELVVAHGLNTQKKDRVKDVAGATARSAERSQDDREDYEASITQWLTSPASDSRALHETTTLRMDETNSMSPPKSGEKKDAEAETSTSSDSPDESADKRWSKKKLKKSKPGKLPPVPKSQSTKDSREAAAEVLRAMTRRR